MLCFRIQGRGSDVSDSFVYILIRNFFLFQTFLEQIKRKFSSSYSGIPLEKISPTVGMNGKEKNSHL